MPSADVHMAGAGVPKIGQTVGADVCTADTDVRIAGVDVPTAGADVHTASADVHTAGTRHVHKSR